MLRGSSPTTTRGLQPAERSLCWFYGKRERKRHGTSLRSSVVGLRFVRRCAVRSKSPQMRSQIRVLACARLTRGRVRLAAGTYSLRLQPPPICGGFALAICRVGCGEDGRAERRRRHDHPLRAQRAPVLLDTKRNGVRPFFNLTSTRLPNTVFAKHHGASWRSAGGVIRQCGFNPRQHPPSDFAPAKSRATGGERFRAQALRARECSPQGGRPHVQRDR